MEVKNIARIGLASRWTTKQQGHFAVRNGLLGQIVVNNQGMTTRIAEKFADSGLGYNGKCYISNSDCNQDAEAVAASVEERVPNLDGKVLINQVGTTIGSHTGPGTVALFFWGEPRTD